ncbi:MAG: hypothetical protein JO352_29405 [Chloroflexi bacterium]|nr:hypothetical protein [Chloroflexota bacterium]
MLWRFHLRPHWLVLAASVSTAVGLLGSSSSAAVPDPGASTNNDDNEAVYRDGYQGAAGYLPVFHPTPLTAAEATTARTSLYPTSGGKTPSPSNVALEFPDQFKLQIACFGRGLDPRGPYAEPPRAPYLIPGNVAAMTFGTRVLRGGGLYIATSPGGFNNTVTGTPNLNPAAGPIVTEENTAGVYEIALGSDGTCSTIRTVSGGQEKAGANGGPQPEFGDFGQNIDGLSFHDGFLYTDDFSGGPEGARSGPSFSAGRVHRVDPRTGTRVALVANLPSEGDHQNDAFVFFNEAGHTWVEFEQGTTTNSGTVDGEGLGDIPCFDVELTPAGEQFFPFTMGYKRTVHNLPGGAPLVDGSVGPNGGHIVRGTLPCSGSTMAVQADSSINADGTNSTLRLTGWGFRNPYGMVVAPKDVPGVGGELVLTNNDVDVRGQRPLANGGDDVWPFEVNGTPPRNWGWPNQINFSSSADPQFGLGNNQLAGDAGAFTENQARRPATQPAQAIVGEAAIFNYLEDSAGHLFREGDVVNQEIDAEFVPGVSLATVDISADGIDVSSNAGFGGNELLHNFFFAGFGNLEFPLGSVPAARVGKDVRRLKVETTSTGAYVGTVQKVFAHNKTQPGGWKNLNTGGFLGPLDLKFSPSGTSMWLVDFGGFFTKDSGAVGGYRCDPAPGDCANGANDHPDAKVPGSQYGISIEQGAGTSMLWHFMPHNAPPPSAADD